MAINTFVVRLIDCAGSSGGVAGGTTEVPRAWSDRTRHLCRIQSAGSLSSTFRISRGEAESLHESI